MRVGDGWWDASAGRCPPVGRGVLPWVCCVPLSTGVTTAETLRDRVDVQASLRDLHDEVLYLIVVHGDRSTVEVHETAVASHPRRLLLSTKAWVRAGECRSAAAFNSIDTYASAPKADDLGRASAESEVADRADVEAPYEFHEILEGQVLGCRSHRAEPLQHIAPALDHAVVAVRNPAFMAGPRGMSTGDIVRPAALLRGIALSRRSNLRRRNLCAGALAHSLTKGDQHLAMQIDLDVGSHLQRRSDAEANGRWQ